MGGCVRFLRKWYYDIDHFTLFFALGLAALGLLMSFSVSPAMSYRIHVGTYHFSVRHVFFCIVGISIMLLVSMFSRISILNMSYAGLFVCICLLGVVLLTSGNIKGSKRWISLGFFAVQPAELLKPFFIIMNAHFLSLKNKTKITSFISVGMLGTIGILLLLQPDFGNTILYSSIWFVQVFLGSVGFGILIASLLIGVVSLASIGFFMFPHFHYRIVNFLQLKAGQEQYQTKKSIESIHNGGFFGTGLGEGDVKYQLPDAHTDYIFATICEEWGAILAFTMLLLYLYFMYRHLASNFTNSKYDIRVIYGLVLMIVIQSCVHIGVNTNLLPSKGITLPLVSYGGSSMLANSLIFGFLLAFTRKRYAFKSNYSDFEIVKRN